MLSFGPLAATAITEQPGIAGPSLPLSSSLASSSSLGLGLVRARALSAAIASASSLAAGVNGLHAITESVASLSTASMTLTRSRRLNATQASLSAVLSASHHTGTLASAIVSLSAANMTLISHHALSGAIVSLSGQSVSLPRARPLSSAIISLATPALLALLRSHVLAQSITSTSTVYGRFIALAYTTYLDNALLAHAIGETAYPMPANYMALFKIAPTIAGGGTESTYSNYARVAVSGAFGAVAGGHVSNTVTISLPVCGASGDTIVAFGAFDAPTAGNLLYFGPCAQAVSYGLAPTFAPGALSVSQA